MVSKQENIIGRPKKITSRYTGAGEKTSGEDNLIPRVLEMKL